MSKDNFSHLISRIERLEKAVFGDKKLSSKISTESTRKTRNLCLDFSLNIRAFVKRFVADKSGPKKFVLLLAYLTKGKIGIGIKLGKIRKEWNKMSGKSLLGKFNRFYPNEAKTQGWVDSKEYGVYCLTDSWQEVYEQ